MARETARIIVEQLDNYLSHTCQDYGERDHEAMMMAIKALEQQPSEDAINRAEAIKTAIEAADDWDGGYNLTRADIIEKAIKALPSVQLKPKTGHWILQPSNKEQGEREFIWWKCSECGQVIFSEAEKDRREYHAFCGRCGTKMVEPQAESEE